MDLIQFLPRVLFEDIGDIAVVTPLFLADPSKSFLSPFTRLRGIFPRNAHHLGHGTGGASRALGGIFGHLS